MRLSATRNHCKTRNDTNKRIYILVIVSISVYIYMCVCVCVDIHMCTHKCLYLCLYLRKHAYILFGYASPSVASLGGTAAGTGLSESTGIAPAIAL